MLQTNKSLTHLDLSHNFISANSCIFESVQCNNTLVNLILWNNSDSGTATSLSEMIRLNSSLTHLDLGCNRFSIYSIFQALHDQHSATLALSSAYFMTDNHMDSDTAISLSKMFRENKLVTHLDLAVCCTLSDSSIFEGLQHNTILWSTWSYSVHIIHTLKLNVYLSLTCSRKQVTYSSWPFMEWSLRLQQCLWRSSTQYYSSQLEFKQFKCKYSNWSRH